MTLYALLGSLELGLISALVALGVYLSFRVLNFPDLTVDGSFPLGGAVAAVLIVAKVDPVIATGAAILAGAAAGALTAWLAVRLRILHLLAGILVMIALFSINLRVMGRPNIALLGEASVFSGLTEWLAPQYAVPAVMLALVLVCVLLIWAFLNTRLGLALRACGVNPRMAGAQAIPCDALVILGMAVSNGLVALAGALTAQSQGAADATMGIGMIVIGLASVIIGETVLRPRTVLMSLVAVVVGAVLYRVLIALGLNGNVLGLKAQDLNLVTAVLVTLAMVLPRLAPRARPLAARKPRPGFRPTAKREAL